MTFYNDYPRPTPNRTPAIVWGVLLVVCVILGFFVYRNWFDRGTPAGTPRIVAARGDLAQDEQATIDLFKVSSPSVVHVTTLLQAQSRWMRSILEIPQGTGSGFVWDDAGDIVTNFHVVRQMMQSAGAARVRLWDHSTWEASVVGIAPNYDLAVLRIKATKTRLRPIPIGESKDLQVGQKVFAIGNPFGLDQSLTTGIVSALGRTFPAETGRAIEDVIQTDAAINPGNSGGPLLDSAGRLIGINTAIYSPSGTSVGVGFAVPVDTINRVVPQLIAQGQITRPYLGVRSSDRISQQLTRQMNVQGLLVLEVEPDSPAARAGLRPAISPEGIVAGDVIQEADSRKIRAADDLYAALERHKPGEQIELKIWRNGNQEAVKIPLDPPKD